MTKFGQRRRKIEIEPDDKALASKYRFEESISLAIVHHANQYLITNGYTNREGLDDLVGSPKGNNGYLRVLDLHRKYKTPMNLHLSGTLLEAVLWHRPDFLEALQEMDSLGLVDWIGSCYGQNILRFFSRLHNRKQLNEELMLYRDHLKVEPGRVEIFWPPERVWDTERLTPIITDRKLLNGGYKYVLMDDRLLHSSTSRSAFDESEERQYEDFTLNQITDGEGLMALPIAKTLRYNIPPLNHHNFKKIEKLLRWLAIQESKQETDFIAIYGDDLEKAAGIGPWDTQSLSRYELFLEWLQQNPWIRVVNLSQWASLQEPAGEKQIDVGTFFEMSIEFGAGEDYEKWYFDPQWDIYRNYYCWSEDRVRSLSDLGTDHDLTELAWKHLLASSWETAWQNPAVGVHGHPSFHGEPSPWIKAIASHSRHAAVIAEAAYWMDHKDNQAHTYLYDIDNDLEEELILKNDKLFAVFTPRWGGRLVYLFLVDGSSGKMVIGNPSDDWNWMEELNKYLERPANHPGALVDSRGEHDRYKVAIDLGSGLEVKVRLTNIQTQKRSFGLQKELSLTYGENEIQVSYNLPDQLNELTIECGFSPDYLNLLRSGREFFSSFGYSKMWKLFTDGTMIWIRLGDNSSTTIDTANYYEIGHGGVVRVKSTEKQFSLWLGSRHLE